MLPFNTHEIFKKSYSFLIILWGIEKKKQGKAVG